MKKVTHIAALWSTACKKISIDQNWKKQKQNKNKNKTKEKKEENDQVLPSNI